MIAHGSLLYLLLWITCVFIQGGSSGEIRAQLERQLTELTQQLDSLQDPARELELQGRIGSLQQDLERLDQARASYEQAVALARALDDREKLLVHLGNLAVVVSAQGDVDLALQYSREALELSQALDRPFWTWQLANNSGAMHLQRGEYAQAAGDFALALEARPDDTDPYSLATVLSNLAVAHMYLGDHADALDLLDRALPLMEEAGSMTGVAAVLSNQGDVRHLMGENDVALRLQQDALALREEHGSEAEVANSLQSLGAVLGQLGRGEEALAALDRALEIQRRLGLTTELAGTLSTLAEVEAALDHGWAAERAAREGLKLAEAQALRSRRLANLESLAEAHAAQGDTDQALRVEREARELERELASEQVRQALVASRAELRRQLDERELALLRKDMELQRQQHKLLAVGAGALLLLALVGWASYLAKRRVLRRLDTALTELREAHHLATRHAEELEHTLVEVNELQDERLRAARLESIGILAGGIAHDFNNILTAFLGNVSMARDALEDRPDVQRLLDSSAVAVESAARLADQLLAFSKGSPPRRELRDLGALVRDAVSFAASGSSAEVRFDLPDDLWPAEVDSGQIAQVLANLVINAQQAMPGGGTIAIQAANVPGDTDALPGSGREPRVRIRVTDSGPGIPRDQRSRVFDPYYTTKAGGTGLGLTTAHTIVERHAGCLRLEGTEGQGASFVVELPACPGATLPAPAPAPPADPGLLRVLAVEDDPLVREMYASAFQAMGVEAQIAENGTEALRLFRSAREQGRGFQVVLLDLTLPGGKDGAMVLTDLREVDPGVRAVVTSGYTSAPEMVDFHAAGFTASLAKPFTMRDVSRALQDALHA